MRLETRLPGEARATGSGPGASGAAVLSDGVPLRLQDGPYSAKHLAPMGLEKYLQTKTELFAYRDRKFRGSEEEYISALKNSTTVYVGNLSTLVEEERLWAIFRLCGEIRRVVMGINRSTLYPCGFSFVDFYDVESARKACCLSGMRLSGKYIKVDVDYGFQEGRQYGRGVFGGQFKEDYAKRKRFKR